MLPVQLLVWGVQPSRPSVAVQHVPSPLFFEQYMRPLIVGQSEQDTSGQVHRSRSCWRNEPAASPNVRRANLPSDIIIITDESGTDGLQETATSRLSQLLIE